MARLALPELDDDRVGEAAQEEHVAFAERKVDLARRWNMPIFGLKLAWPNTGLDHRVVTGIQPGEPSTPVNARIPANGPRFIMRPG